MQFLDPVNRLPNMEDISSYVMKQNSSLFSALSKYMEINTYKLVDTPILEKSDLLFLLCTDYKTVLKDISNLKDDEYVLVLEDDVIFKELDTETFTGLQAALGGLGLGDRPFVEYNNWRIFNK